MPSNVRSSSARAAAIRSTRWSSHAQSACPGFAIQAAFAWRTEREFRSLSRPRSSTSWTACRRARLVLESAAVAGDPFEPQLAFAIAGIDTIEGLGPLDELLDADVVHGTAIA